MDTSIMKKEPLTDEEIYILRKSISECDNPYTEDEVKRLAYGGDWDLDRYFAYQSRKILEENGIPVEE